MGSIASGLSELLAAADAIDEEFYDGLVVDVRGVSSDRPGETLSLVVVLGAQQREMSRWRIEVRGLAEHALKLESHCAIEHSDQHPLLLDHVGRRGDLYFRGPIESPSAVLGDLLTAHQELFGTWRPVQAFWNEAFGPGSRMLDLLAADSGLIASGPMALMEAFNAVLASHGVSGNILDKGPIKRWDDELQWVEETRDLSVLTLNARRPTRNTAGAIDFSYVVAQVFEVDRIA